MAAPSGPFTRSGSLDSLLTLHGFRPCCGLTVRRVLSDPTMSAPRGRHFCSAAVVWPDGRPRRPTAEIPPSLAQILAIQAHCEVLGTASEAISDG